MDIGVGGLGEANATEEKANAKEESARRCAGDGMWIRIKALAGPAQRPPKRACCADGKWLQLSARIEAAAVDPQDFIFSPRLGWCPVVKDALLGWPCRPSRALKPLCE